MNHLAKILRSVADELDAGAPAAATPVDPYADALGPPGDMDPLEWAKANPEAARRYSLRMVYYAIGGHRAPDTSERDAGMDARDKAEQAQYHAGNVAVGTLDVKDAAYFAHMAGPYKDKTGTDIRWAGVVGGSAAEINAFRSLGDNWRNNYPADQYDGKLKAIIKAMMGG